MVKALTSKNFSLGHAEYLEIYDGVKTGVESTNSFFLSCAYFAVCILCLYMVIGQGHKSKKDFSPGFRGTCPSTACHLVVVSSKPVDFFFSLTYLPWSPCAVLTSPTNQLYWKWEMSMTLRIICEELEKKFGHQQTHN